MFQIYIYGTMYLKNNTNNIKREKNHNICATDIIYLLSI